MFDTGLNFHICRACAPKVPAIEVLLDTYPSQLCLLVNISYCIYLQVGTCRNQFSMTRATQRGRDHMPKLAPLKPRGEPLRPEGRHSVLALLATDGTRLEAPEKTSFAKTNRKKLCGV